MKNFFLAAILAALVTGCAHTEKLCLSGYGVAACWHPIHKPQVEKKPKAP